MLNFYIVVLLMFLYIFYLKNIINILVYYKMYIKFIFYFKEKSLMIVCVLVIIKVYK